jgi:hypothetical protein
MHYCFSVQCPIAAAAAATATAGDAAAKPMMIPVSSLHPLDHHRHNQ